MSKIRYSKFELLRILAMFLIVAHHYSVHGNWDFELGVSVNKLYVQSLSIGGKIGVDLFVLISAFFFSQKTKINVKEPIIKIIIQVYFYSLSILLFFFFVKGISIKEFFKSIIPFQYWFVNAYLLMILFSPFLNIVIRTIKQKKHLIIIIISTIILNIPILNNQIGNFGLFIYLYFISAYIRKYLTELRINKIFLLLIAMLSLLAIFISILLLDYFSLKNLLFNHPLYFIQEKSIFVIVASVSIFILFNQLKVGESKFINLISASMFGVYLIHDNSIMRPFIWRELLNVRQYYDSNFIYIESIFSILIVFITCSMIDVMRTILFKWISISFKTLVKDND